MPTVVPNIEEVKPRKQRESAYRARSIGGKHVRTFNSCHPATHVRITGQVKVLHYYSVGPLLKLQFYGSIDHLHVRLFRKTRHVVLQYYLLVPHFFTNNTTSHC